MFYRILKKRCVEQSVTVIAAMHDINLASLFCDRLVLLDGGRVAACGSPIEVLNEETLHHVFQVQISVVNDRVSNIPFILPAALS
jgi:iron complex transport system ATP-binding protein